MQKSSNRVQLHNTALPSYPLLTHGWLRPTQGYSSYLRVAEMYRLGQNMSLSAQQKYILKIHIIKPTGNSMMLHSNLQRKYPVLLCICVDVRQIEAERLNCS